MARARGFHSGVIAWLKILLPLAALALLSTLFLLSRSGEPALSVPFAEALRGGETATEQVTNPYYAGTTDRGDALTMTAARARPDGQGVIRADALNATLDFKDGSRLRLNADSASLSDRDRQASLGHDELLEYSRHGQAPGRSKRRTRCRALRRRTSGSSVR